MPGTDLLAVDVEDRDRPIATRERPVRPLRVLAVANWNYASTPAPWAWMRIDALRRAGAVVDVLSEECVDDRRGFVRLWRALNQRLAHERYDVVAPLYGSLLGLLCAAQRRVPCALSFAGSDLCGEPGRNRRLMPSSLLVRSASHLAAALAKGTSVRTVAMRDELWWPPSRRRAEVIPSGVDLSRFRPIDRAEARRRRGLPLVGKRVAFVAFAAERRAVKRLELARAALALLDGVALDVIDGVPLEEMPFAYSAADALVLTSHREGSPNCVKEALACAVPVVSVDVGDVRDVIDGLTNCAVVAADPQKIADALGRALADGRGCPDGPARMMERHSIDAMARRFIRFYDRVAGRA
jgi:teichuronic acid biosynthesis glycosyltransferase TuaC